jgi:hypothetical protein
MSAHDDRSARGTSPAGGSGADFQERLGWVLADLVYPARRWQVLAVSDLYGVDAATRALLEQLPERRYHSLGEVVGVLTAVLVGRPVAAVGTAGTPPSPPTTRRPVAGPPAPARPAVPPSVPPTAPPAVPPTPVA